MGLAPPSAPGDLASLLARIEALSGPDREVDCDLTFLFDRPQYAFSGGPVPREEVDGVISPAYTASLDSALALVERLAPRGMNCWGFDVSPGRIDAYLSRNCTNDHETHWLQEASGPTPALAILSALIRSLQHAD